jgi:hypothetical protein
MITLHELLKLGYFCFDFWLLSGMVVVLNIVLLFIIVKKWRFYQEYVFLNDLLVSVIILIEFMEFFS